MSASSVKPVGAKPGPRTFPAFASKRLAIRAKSGKTIPFRLNAVQRALHEKLERQRKTRGRVRALVLKARQPGVSTYVEGRFYWQVTRRAGARAFILTHLRDASDAIFEIVERFYAQDDPELRPHLGASNARELLFDRLDSGYRVGTAGSRAIGRGHTIQYFHGSEVAHWPNAGAHMAGVLQAVPDRDDTEIILESTANGPGGLFFDLCKAAERGDSEFDLIFIPWFDHREYVASPPKGWVVPSAIVEYGAQHDLSARQLYWAWRKNEALARACGGPGDQICWLFRQEYPATADEAFHGAGHDGLIRPELVIAARSHVAGSQDHAPLILGVDIARGGACLTSALMGQIEEFA